MALALALTETVCAIPFPRFVWVLKLIVPCIPHRGFEEVYCSRTEAFCRAGRARGVRAQGRGMGLAFIVGGGEDWGKGSFTWAGVYVLDLHAGSSGGSTGVFLAA